MNTEIHSFESIEIRAKTAFEPHTALISIGDSDASPPNLVNRPEWIIRLVFDDVDYDETEDANYSYHMPFTHKHAERIVRFVSMLKDHASLMICQCEFGQSRSAAVAAAIREHYFGDGITIFSDNRYYPNKRVYAMLMEEFKKQESPQ